MPLIVPGIVRFTVHQSMFSRQIANILDYKISDQDVTFGRPEAALDQAKIIAKEWKLRFLVGQSSSLKLEKISWVDLNSLDGSTGEFQGDADIPLNVVGGLTGDALTPSTAVLFTKIAAGGRGTKSGRMYLAGLSEAMNLSGNSRFMNATLRNDLQAAAALFLSNTNQEAGVAGVSYDSDMHVVHQRPAVPAFSSVVTAIIPQDLLATQRRRLRG